MYTISCTSGVLALSVVGGGVGANWLVSSMGTDPHILTLSTAVMGILILPSVLIQLYRKFK